LKPESRALALSLLGTVVPGALAAALGFSMGGLMVFDDGSDAEAGAVLLLGG
jgi:hypothetical protein